MRDCAKFYGGMEEEVNGWTGVFRVDEVMEEGEWKGISEEFFGGKNGEDGDDDDGKDACAHH
jgi:hypothetical protein